jgi:Family of unknown function (DUF6134)
MRALGTGAALALALTASAAPAEDAGEYTFTVLKDGAPVGEHRFTFDRDGARIEIEEETDIEVWLAMIPVYEFEHERREVWLNGRALSIDASTNNNGEQLDITVRPDGDGYIRTVNGRVDKFDDSTEILTFWRRDLVEHDAFFSVVEDKTMRVSFEYLGKDVLKVDGQRMPVDHYRMVGDEERELWFDPAGHVAKVEFERQGSEIEYLRNEARPRPLR